jgi:copper chaperone
MTTFRIPDMTCGHCASTIARAVATVAKDAGLDFDIQKKLVRISGDTPEAELAKAIVDAGYTVEAIPVSPAPVESRAGGCCCARRNSSPVDAS